MAEDDIVPVVPNLPIAEEEHRREELEGGDIQWPRHIPKLIHWWNMKVVPAKVVPERLSNRALEDVVITCFCKLSTQLTNVVVENILFM